MPPSQKNLATDSLKQRCVFWGKFLEERSVCLPLAAHCLDVALVVRGLCGLDAVRRVLERTAGCTLEDQQLDRLAVLAMLHDVGKANLGFQLKVFDPRAPKAGHIRELSLLLDSELLEPELHESFSQCLPPEMPGWFIDEENTYSYFMAAFSHHGRPLMFQGKKIPQHVNAKQWWRRQGPWDPMGAVAEIVDWTRAAFPQAFMPGGPELPSAPRFHHRLAGLLMLADWLGSHAGWFPVQATSLAERLQHGRETVPALLRAVGLDASPFRPVLIGGPQTFSERFLLPTSYPLQQATDLLDPGDDNTRLIIAESETGSGKTEAALNWFFRLFAAGKVDSLYFALPTRVAAREIHDRVKAAIDRWFPDPAVRPATILAVPGYAGLELPNDKKILPDERTANRWQDDPDLEQRERYWAAERPKRFLAATVAVGTVDQALLSAIQTAHAHLRSVCLDRSLLVVDEVHASDLYMTRLLQSLLSHHLGVGGRAMLLSATLGARARHELTNVASDSKEDMPSLAQSESVPYPSITLADGIPQTVGRRQSDDGKRIRFEMVPKAFAPEGVSDQVVAALAVGARVLVVMNTVARVNSLLRALEDHPSIDPAWLFQCGGTVCPHHGRFAPSDRRALDRAVGLRFGKKGLPGPVLLLGSQTLEQSLDIDADLMITDLAPADVLLQRVGRLHRHNRTRPPGYETPVCLVLTPKEELESALNSKGHVSGVFKGVGYGSVYEDLRGLELTKRFLVNQPVIGIPTDNRRLVEAVTHPDSLNSLTGPSWEAHRQEIEGGELAKAIAAGYATAVFDQYFGEFVFNEAGGRMATRLGLGSLQLRVDKPFISPFGQLIAQIVIPAHMAPPQVKDNDITVVATGGETTHLQYAGREYRYGRYGLEVDR